MKSLLLTFAFLFSQISFAAPATPISTEGKKIDLAMDLSIDGKHVASPKTVVTEGDPATVTQKTEDGEYFITIASMKADAPKGMKNPENKKVLKFQFAVGKIEKNGKEIILSRPQVIALEGEKSTIEVGDKKSTVSLTMTAKYL